MDRLQCGPPTRETTGFGGKGIHLIGSLPHMAKKACHRMGAANRPRHHWWKRRTGEEMLLLFPHTPDGFGRALLIRGLEGVQMELGILFRVLLPDGSPFGRDLLPFAVGDRVEDSALCLDQTALPWGCRKQRGHSSQQPVLSIRDDQVDPGPSPRAPVLEPTLPAIFVFLRTRPYRQHLFVPLPISGQGCSNARGSDGVAMADANRDAIEVHDAGMGEQGTHAPGFIVFGEALVEPTHGAGAGSHAQERLSPLAHLLGTGS